MRNKFDEMAAGHAQSVTQQQFGGFLGFGMRVAGVVLTCFGLAQAVPAQISILCDTAGDTTFSSGKGGPAVPSWLDIVQAEIAADNSGNLFFTLTVDTPVPAVPAWNGVDDGGQLWWGWRLVDNLATDTTLKSGCVKAPGSNIPAGYFLDLIWDVTTSRFSARLLDDTTCAQSPASFAFSPDRTQIIIEIPQASLSNAALIPDPNNFQFLAATEVWKANSPGNNSFFTVDVAPNTVNGQLVAVTWSASSVNNYFCQ